MPTERDPFWFTPRRSDVRKFKRYLAENKVYQTNEDLIKTLYK